MLFSFSIQDRVIQILTYGTENENLLDNHSIVKYVPTFVYRGLQQSS